MTFPTKMIIAAAFVTALPVSALAQSQDRPPRGPNLAEMATALGITEAQVETCLPRPPEGERPAAGERPERPDPSVITQCLQDANPGLTTAKVGDVLESFGPPERPKG